MHLTSRARRRPALAALALATSLLGAAGLAGCGGSDNNTTSPSGGIGSLSATFTAGAGYNGDTNAITGATLYRIGSPASYNGQILMDNLTRNVLVSINDPNLAAGNSYTIGAPPAGVTVSVVYDEQAGASTDPSSDKAWAATGGTLTVDTVTTSKVTFHVTSATMSPAKTTASGLTNQAAGTFTLGATAL